jgi:protein-L-isoaspartate(D-aspartate) O-methyltransferase
LAYIDLLSSVHKATQRDYLARVNDPEFPKAKAAQLAKQWAYDYWDGDRRYGYGGYTYMPGRWKSVALEMIETYRLGPGSKVLDVGCGNSLVAEDMVKDGFNDVTGVDISPSVIAAMQVGR